MAQGLVFPRGCSRGGVVVDTHLLRPVYEKGTVSFLLPFCSQTTHANHPRFKKRKLQVDFVVILITYTCLPIQYQKFYIFMVSQIYLLHLCPLIYPYSGFHNIHVMKLHCNQSDLAETIQQLFFVTNGEIPNCWQIIPLLP